MRYSDWSSLNVGIEEPYSEYMSKISIKGRKIYRLMRKLRGRLNDNSVDYVMFSMAFDEFTELLDIYRDFIGNIVYSDGSPQVAKKFNKDIKNINQRLDFETAYKSSYKGDRKLQMSIFYSELRHIMYFILLFLKRCVSMDKNFHDSVIFTVKLMGGKMEKKQFVPPSPDEKLNLPSSEEKSEKVDEDVVADEGLDLWKELAEKV